MATAVAASDGSSSATFTVRRVFAGMLFTFVTWPPPSRRYVIVTLAAVVPGLMSRTKVVKKLPVAPSARNQSVAGAITPRDPWPALKIGVPKYIARSAAPAMSKVTTVPNA